MAHQTSYNKAPPLLSASKTYEDWKKKINIWNQVSTLDAKSKASQVFLNLTGEAEEAVLELEETDIHSDNGLTNILNRLDRLYKKDETLQKFEWFEKFESYSRSEDMSILQHISKFEQIYNKVKKYGSTMSDDLLAFKLLKTAKLSPANEKLAKATGEMKYDEMKNQLKKIFTENADMTSSLASSSISSSSMSNVKVEEINCAEEETYFVKRGSFPQNSNMRRNVPNQQGQNRSKFYQSSSRKGRNPVDNQGKVLRCHHCESVNHLANACPDRQGTANRTYAVEDCSSAVEECSSDVVDCMLAEDEISIVLFQDNFDDPKKMDGLLSQSRNSAVLDCGAGGKSVCGDKWLDDYKCNLPESEKEIEVSGSDGVYRFGDGVRTEAIASAKIPAVVGPKKVIIDADVLDRDIPLLLSRKSMKKANMTINFANDTADVFGKNFPLNVTKSGHYTLPLCPTSQLLQRIDRDEARIILNIEASPEALCNAPPLQALPDIEANQVISILLTVTDPSDKTAVATKLHISFAHATVAQMLRLLKAAGQPWCSDKELHRAVEKVIESCETCLKFKKTPPRPVVGLPLATKFLQSVGMDLKQYHLKIILHLVDHATRLSVAVFIPNKKAPTVVKAILRYWISVYGATEKFLSDNGGEFINSEFTEMCERFNIDVKTTGAEAPWSNGLVERHHVIITHMLDKVLHETKCDMDIALAWCVNAKNSLQSVHGFSPFQLVLGRNPKLPTALANRPPALASSQPVSEILRQNLNALHAARRAFIESEHSERVKRALSHNIRTSNNQRFLNGDLVYYKRLDNPEWKGPGTVIGQDGQQVLLKHGGYLQRVHTCRIQHAKPRVVVETDATAAAKAPEPQMISKNYVENSSFAVEKPAIDSDSDEDVFVVPPDPPLGNIEPVATVETVEGTLDEVAGPSSVLQELWQELPQGDFGVDNVDEIHAVLSLDKLRPGHLVKYTTENHPEHQIAKLLSLGGKRKGKYKNTWNIQLLSGDSEVMNFDTDVTSWEVLMIDETSSDEIICNEVFLATQREETNIAKSKELQAWIDQDVYEAVDNEGQSAISVKWVITEKMIEGRKGIKARLVARGFEEVKDFRTDSPTISREGMRVTLAVIAANGWVLQSIDIKTAFLQGKHLERTVFLKPPREAHTDKLWRLNKCVYGLGDAPRNFYLKLSEELITFGMVVSTLDKALFFAFKDRVLIGIIACHVDDMLYGGNLDFQPIIDNLRQSLTVSTEQCNAFAYVGISLKQNSDFSITINQDAFAASIKEISLSAERMKQKQAPVTEVEKSNMRSVIGQLNWLSGITRPDLCFDVCQFSSKVKNAVVSDLILLNKVVHKARKHSGGIVFPRLDMNKVEIKLFADASFNNLPDGGSQEGHIIFICDKSNCAPLAWMSGKIKRIVRSTLAAEAVALNDACDNGLFLKRMVSEMFVNELQTDISLSAYSDNKSTVDAIHSTTSVNDKKTRLEISLLRQYVERKEVDIHLVKGKVNLSDLLTKRGASSKNLLSTLESGSFIGVDGL